MLAILQGELKIMFSAGKELNVGGHRGDGKTIERKNGVSRPWIIAAGTNGDSWKEGSGRKATADCKPEIKKLKDIVE